MYLPELDSEEVCNTKRIKRILTSDLPMYFALVSRVTRVKQESTMIGNEGGVLSSNVVPQVQAVFPRGTLTRPISVGLQVGTSMLCQVIDGHLRFIYLKLLLYRIKIMITYLFNKG